MLHLCDEAARDVGVDTVPIIGGCGDLELLRREGGGGREVDLEKRVLVAEIAV